MITILAFFLFLNVCFTLCKQTGQIATSQYPDLYKFIANNAYICSTIPRADGSMIVFLTEAEGKQCTKCNNPVKITETCSIFQNGIGHACGKMIIENKIGQVSCFAVPSLCIATFSLRYGIELHNLNTSTTLKQASMKVLKPKLPSKKLKRQNKNMTTANTISNKYSHPKTSASPNKQRLLHIGTKPTEPSTLVTVAICEDWHNLCCFWATIGECTRNPFWMRRNCAKTCGTCHCSARTAETCQPKEIKCIIPTTTSSTTMSTTTETTTAESTTPLPTTLKLRRNITRPFTPPNNGFRRTQATRTTTTTTTFTTSTTTLPITTTTTTTPSFSKCYDFNEKCSFWSLVGECSLNPFYMRPNCQKSCNSCGEKVDSVYASTPRSGCVNGHQLCNYWAHIGECHTNSNYMLPNCKHACRIC